MTSAKSRRCLVVALVLPLVGCGSAPLASPPSAASPTATTATTTTSTTAAPVATSSTTVVASTTTSTTDPGSLPQTDALPPASSPQFSSEMAAFWRGVTADSVTPAMPAFFPLGAYEQVKAISDAAYDYQSRLVGGYSLDIQAAHNITGSSATLLSVEVPMQYAHWVQPGTCYNRLGYFEVPNSRVVYEAGGIVRSFGIASMISWRGVWYIVHLGAISHPDHRGELDDPSLGPGVSQPYSTC